VRIMYERIFEEKRVLKQVRVGAVCGSARSDEGACVRVLLA
jgi:hypothetical protein